MAWSGQGALCWAVFAVLVALCSAQYYNGTESTSEALVWQGFDHAWQRKLLHLFDTPHRLGSFANYIEQEQFSGSSVQAESNVTFTPGVNGDYAYPATYFSLVDGSASEGKVHAMRGMASQSFEDSANNSTGVLEAETHISIPIAIQAPTISSDFSVVLRGFRLDMHCNPDLQPPGGVCNSNGIWASQLAVNITECSAAGQNGAYDCTATFDLVRGCNPGCNSPIAPKPFNYVMSYDLYIYYTFIAGVHATVEPIKEKQNTDLGIVTVNVTTAGDPGYPSGTVGVTGFSWDLQEFDGIENLGRYLERLAYNVQSVAYDAESGSATYQAELGYYTALTTAPAKGVYQLDATLLQFGSGVSVLEPNASPVNGTVCISDELFHCEFNIDGVKLEETTNDVVSIDFVE